MKLHNRQFDIFKSPCREDRPGIGPAIALPAGDASRKYTVFRLKASG